MRSTRKHDDLIGHAAYSYPLHLLTGAYDCITETPKARPAGHTSSWCQPLYSRHLVVECPKHTSTFIRASQARAMFQGLATGKAYDFDVTLRALFVIGTRSTKDMLIDL